MNLVSLLLIGSNLAGQINWLKLRKSGIAFVHRNLRAIKLVPATIFLDRIFNAIEFKSGSTKQFYLYHLRAHRPQTPLALVKHSSSSLFNSGLCGLFGSFHCPRRILGHRGTRVERKQSNSNVFSTGFRTTLLIVVYYRRMQKLTEILQIKSVGESQRNKRETINDI